MVCSTVLYGYISWTLTLDMEQKLRTVQRQMLRRVLGRAWVQTPDPEQGENQYVKYLQDTALQIEGLIQRGLVIDWVAQRKALHRIYKDTVPG